MDALNFSNIESGKSSKLRVIS